MKKSTLIVVLLALALGAYAYFFEFKSEKKRDDEEGSKPAFTFKTDEVTACTLTNKGQTIALELQGNSWAIIQPIKTNADASAVETLLGNISSTSIDRSLAQSENLKRGAGLENPAVVLEVKLKNGASHKILLGQKDPTESNVYAQIDQNPNVLLLPLSLLTSTEKSLTDLRSKEILKVQPDLLTRLSIKNQNGNLVAEKGMDDKWIAKEPTDLKGKEIDAAKFLSAFSTPATEVIDAPDEKTKAALAKIVAEAELANSNSTSEKLFISAAEGDNVFVRVQGKNEIFKAPKAILDSLNFKIAEVIVAPSPAAVVASPPPTEKPATSSGGK